MCPVGLNKWVSALHDIGEAISRSLADSLPLEGKWEGKMSKIIIFHIFLKLLTQNTSVPSLPTSFSTFAY